MPKINTKRMKVRKKDGTWESIPGFGDGVYPIGKTSAMTQPVGRDEQGRLYTAPTGGGSEKLLRITAVKDANSGNYTSEYSSREISDFIADGGSVVLSILLSDSILLETHITIISDAYDDVLVYGTVQIGSSKGTVGEYSGQDIIRTCVVGVYGYNIVSWTSDTMTTANASCFVPRLSDLQKGQIPVFNGLDEDGNPTWVAKNVAENAVLYTVQELTEDEQAQARENIGAVSADEVEQATEGKADKVLASADGDLWEIAVEADGDVVTHKNTGEVEIVAESLESATLADNILTLNGITATYGAVIIPDASEISIDVPTNTEINQYFADPLDWQHPSFGWFLLQTDGGYITVHTTNFAEVYRVSADLKTWTSITSESGAIENVAKETMRVVLDNGTATVYSDDIITYSVRGISGIGYCASSVKATTVYGVTVIHRQAMPTKSKLIFTGAVEAEYDGSEEVEVKIPEASTIEVDETLTESGKAADAKVVGDKLAALESALGSYITDVDTLIGGED